MTTAESFPKDHTSVSQINLYLMCPLKYRFVYVDELPRPFKPVGLAFGSAIHSALAWWHKQRLRGVDPEFKDVARTFIADLTAQKADNIAFKNGKEEQALTDLGKEMLAVYMKNYQGASPVAIEMPFRIPLVDKETGEELDLPLDGFIDLVEDGDVVVELKTASRGYSSLDVTQHLQLTAYAYAYEWLYGKRPELRLDCLLKTKKPRLESWESKRSQDDQVRFFHIAKSVGESITSRHFHPNPGWQCAGCEFFGPCQKWRSEPTRRSVHAGASGGAR